MSIPFNYYNKEELEKLDKILSFYTKMNDIVENKNNNYFIEIINYCIKKREFFNMSELQTIVLMLSSYAYRYNDLFARDDKYVNDVIDIMLKTLYLHKPETFNLIKDFDSYIIDSIKEAINEHKKILIINSEYIELYKEILQN